MPPSSQVYPLVNGVLPPEIISFYHKLYIRTEEIALGQINRLSCCDGKW